MKIIRPTILILFLIFLCFRSESQPENRNIISLELFGKSAYFFDVNYSRKITDRFQLGIGLGYMDHHSTVTPFGVKGKIYDLSLPLFGAFLIGNGKHHMVSEFGTFIGFNLTKLEGYRGFEGILYFISFGYEFEGDHFLVRVPLYLAYTDVYEFPLPVMPWAGISFGYTF